MLSATLMKSGAAKSDLGSRKGLLVRLSCVASTRVLCELPCQSAAGIAQSQCQPVDAWPRRLKEHMRSEKICSVLRWQWLTYFTDGFLVFFQSAGASARLGELLGGPRPRRQKLSILVQVALTYESNSAPKMHIPSRRP